MMDLGRRVFGAAAGARGLIGLAFGDFAAVWQPVPPETPGFVALAYAAATLEVLAGVALQARRFARPAALALAALFLVFALLWARRLLGMPTLFAIWLG